MISRDDIDAFAADNADGFKAAAKFAERADRKLPPDRWATSAEMKLVARGIRAQLSIIAMLTEIAQMQAEELAAIHRRAVE